MEEAAIAFVLDATSPPVKTAQQQQTTYFKPSTPPVASPATTTRDHQSPAAATIDAQDRCTEAVPTATGESAAIPSAAATGASSGTNPVLHRKSRRSGRPFRSQFHPRKLLGSKGEQDVQPAQVPATSISSDGIVVGSIGCADVMKRYIMRHVYQSSHVSVPHDVTAVQHSTIMTPVHIKALRVIKRRA